MVSLSPLRQGVGSWLSGMSQTLFATTAENDLIGAFGFSVESTAVRPCLVVMSVFSGNNRDVFIESKKIRS